MKKNILVVFFAILFLVSFASCSNNSIPATDDSKVLATVDNVEITQQQVATRKKDSEFSQQERSFSDKEVLDRIIEEELLLIKAKELKITMTDEEVKESYREMMQLMSSKKYIDGDEDKLDKNAIEGLRNMFIIQRTKKELGSDIDTTLEQLRQEIKIEYYD